MRSLLLFLFAIFISSLALSQEEIQGLPKGLSSEEKENARALDYHFPSERGIETPPDFPNIRTAAEWEEIQALTIAWQGYTGILKQIVAASVSECEVIVLSEDPASTETFLLNANWGGPVDLTNVTIIQTDLNSIWMRDYGANTVYGNEVDDLFLVDWIYNRPRPDDDLSPEAVANYLGLDIYSTTAAPNDLMNTGGNYMSDGFGKAFCSELVIEENQGGNTGWGPQFPNQTEAEIDGIMNSFMGIDEYIKMTMLPFDGIHHIDMHMKLLNEETLLVSEYPEGVADGPQIEANLQYVLDNFTTKWGTPFKVVRVPVPPQESNGLYPDQNGWYCTYTNSVFVNNTVLLPTYYEAYDSIAIRIYEENLPGYNIVPIDCDDNGQAIISASGAIHCITQSVGVEDPLLISYEQLPNTNINDQDYTLQAYINHRSGISSANLYYKTSPLGAYTSVPMSSIGGNEWEANIPAQPFGTRVYYYVEGNANSGKSLNRPMPAPEGFYTFDVVNEVFGCTDVNACNYNPEATIDDLSCELAGCTDENACNFNPDALCDDGSCSTQVFTLNISTDCWGEEVTWNIVDDENNIIATDPPGDYADESSFTSSFCLSPNCYTFNILDSYGDGMNGSAFTCDIDGDYSFEDGEGNIVFEMLEPNYGSGTSHAFCVESETVFGCTDDSACNFNAAATEEDGSCVFAIVYYFDGDQDGFGDPENSITTCIPPGNAWSENGADCDDLRFDVNPDATGTGEGIDNNCDGEVLGSEILELSPCPPDLNNDGMISTPDLLIVLGDFGCQLNCVADINDDAIVNSADVLILLALFGNTCE